MTRLPPVVNRALGVALIARLAQFVEAFLAVLLVTEAGASTPVVAAVLLAQQAGATLGAPLAGELSDRRGARDATGLGLLLAGISAIVLASSEQTVLLVGAAAVYGMAAAGWRLSLQAGVAQGLAESTENNRSAELRGWAFGSLIWVSNAGALVSATAALAGVPLRSAFVAQGILSVAAALLAFGLPRWRSMTGPQEPSRRIDRNLILIALAMAPATALMFQAFSGLAIVYPESDYRVMVMTNAVVLVLGQPLIWSSSKRLGAGSMLLLSTALLALGLAAASVYEDVVVSTLIWSFAELVLISMTPAVVAGLAPHGQMGRYQATFQLIQGAVAALAMFGGPLLAAGSVTDFVIVCLSLGALGALSLRALSGTLSASLAQPVSCPCGAMLCRCDAGHLSCASPSPVIVHQAHPAREQGTTR